MAETTNTTGKSLVNDLIEAGIHFGQRSSSWNPKMGRFIYGKRNGIHVIDIRETVKGLLRAKKFIGQTVADGKDVCFVGTKRQAREILQQRVTDVKMHWVTERWLGGTLTNFRTIRSRLKRLEELEALEESGEMATYSKKMESQLHRERKKIKRNLDGIRRMAKLPGAIIAIDVVREKNALLEARKLGIPTICLIDTDGDPDLVDIPIPGNDDSMRSIDVIVRELCAAVLEGKNKRVVASREEQASQKPHPGEVKAPNAPPSRRSQRARFRASDDAPPAPAHETNTAPGSVLSDEPAAPASISMPSPQTSIAADTPVPAQAVQTSPSVRTDSNDE